MSAADGDRRRAGLQVVEADGAGRHLLLDRPVLHVGRADGSCGLLLAGPDIAPHHCCLRQIGERWWLFDRGSPAGTFLNSERVREPTVLREGDRISVGLHVLEFRSAPRLDLEHTLDRLGGPICLEFAAPPVHRRPAPRRPRGSLRTAGLAAAAGFAVTLSIAADFAPEPVSAPVPPDMSLQPAAENPPAPGAPPVTRYLAEPQFELPADALAVGRPDAGSLLHALQLPPSPDYTIRCPAHAYGSSATIAGLMRALAGFRERSGYRGELVVGDLSQPGGGRYGPHRSHQSGRDVDLWLPVKGGSYRRGCVHCGTDLCRPEPDEVDWHATWELVTALAARGQVQDIFLAWDLQPALRRAAHELGAPDAALARQIQHPVRGRAALIKNADGHTHHLHVRFRCSGEDPGCVATP